MSHTPSHEVKRPVAQLYDPSAGGKAPLTALLAALARVPGQIPGSSSIGPENEGAAAFTARLCSALSLQRDSLLSNIQNNKSAQDESQNEQPCKPAEPSQTEQSSSRGPGARSNAQNKAADLEDHLPPGGQVEREITSTDAQTALGPADSRGQQPMSEEAKKRRRQEINRESARRVRKRKTEAHVQLQEEVLALKAAATSSAADQAVIVRYASELTKERDALLQRAAALESKWIAAECRNVILRQRIADLTGASLQQVAPDTGQVMGFAMSDQKTEGTAPESLTQFTAMARPGQDSNPEYSK